MSDRTVVADTLEYGVKVGDRYLAADTSMDAIALACVIGGEVLAQAQIGGGDDWCVITGGGGSWSPQEVIRRMNESLRREVTNER